MQLKLILPQVVPNDISPPAVCPYEACGGRRFRFHQAVEKPVRDTQYWMVNAHRYRCLSCGRTLRVYPPGVTRAQRSLRVQGLAVLLYFLGCNYDEITLTIELLDVYMCKSQVYQAVQAASERVPGLARRQIFDRPTTPGSGQELTPVEANRQHLTLGVIVDQISTLVITLDALPGEDTKAFQAWLAPIARAIRATLNVTDSSVSVHRQTQANSH